MDIKYLAHELCLFYMIFNADWNIDSEHVIPLITWWELSNAAWTLAVN